jgi:hypothetical protein
VPRELLVDGPVPPTLPEEPRRDMRLGVTGLCWAAAIAVAFYFASGGQLRAAARGLFPLILGLGSFLRAWLTAREIAGVQPTAHVSSRMSDSDTALVARVIANARRRLQHQRARTLAAATPPFDGTALDCRGQRSSR